MLWEPNPGLARSFGFGTLSSPPIELILRPARTFAGLGVRSSTSTRSSRSALAVSGIPHPCKLGFPRGERDDRESASFPLTPSPRRCPSRASFPLLARESWPSRFVHGGFEEKLICFAPFVRTCILPPPSPQNQVKSCQIFVI